ncbi:hypothetical protein LCGC14_0811360 [marine sediment metagenome]|uniref:Uncharacterized protein n=1 Tax=marine sediment metagenome TaxID=412755 RepID=A0A0F9PLM0_9ZZZZ
MNVPVLDSLSMGTENSDGITLSSTEDRNCEGGDEWIVDVILMKTNSE